MTPLAHPNAFDLPRLAAAWPAVCGWAAGDALTHGLAAFAAARLARGDIGGLADHAGQMARLAADMQAGAEPGTAKGNPRAPRHARGSVSSQADKETQMRAGEFPHAGTC